mgnify:CR=1 FL=1
MKFLELISVDEKTIAAKELNLTAKKAALQVDRDILSAEDAVNAAEERFTKSFTSKPYSPGLTVNAKRDLIDAKQTLADLEELKAEYFSETTKKAK